MKTKAILIALLAVITLPLMAQRDDPEATVKAATAIIKNYSNYDALNTVIEDVCSKFKKNPRVHAGIAKAFWWNGADSARAILYANKAIAIDPKYADAYVLHGDIWAHYGDTARAEQWYNKAINANPQSYAGYDALASLTAVSNPDASIAILQRIKDTHPDYPFHLKAARIYDKLASNNINTGENTEKAIFHYDQAERDSMNDYDFTTYSNYYRALRQYDKTMEIATDGLAHFPDCYGLVQICAKSTYNMGNYEEAEKYIKRQFTFPDSLLQSGDYHNYINVLMNLKKYNEAVSFAKEFMNDSIATDADREFAIGKIAEAYKELGEYAKAEKTYQDYIANRTSKGTLEANDLYNYAKLYTDKADESNGQEKIDAYLKADSIYNIMAQKFVQNASFALYHRYMITSTIYPDLKEGRAAPICNNLISVLLAKPERDKTDNARLTVAYNYLGLYYLKNDNIKKCKLCAQKILDIQPDHEWAQKIVTAFKKY